MDPIIVGYVKSVKKGGEMFLRWVKDPMGGEVSSNMLDNIQFVADNALRLCLTSGEDFNCDEPARKARKARLPRAV